MLVDTPHPDMIRMPVNGVSKKMYDLTDADMEAAAEIGRKRNMPMSPDEGKIAPPFDRLPADDAGCLQLDAPADVHESHVWAMKKAREASRDIDPLVILKVQAAFAKRIKDQRFDVPTIVITRAKSAEGSEPWVDSQQQLADAATHGKLVRAVGSGHDIQLEQPQLITGAVRELLATEKGNAKAR